MSRLLRTLDRVKGIGYTTVSAISRAGLFVGLALLGGIGSSWYLSTMPSLLTTERTGPWVTWVAAGRVDADPYTRARFARVGSLPLNAAATQTYEAQVDSAGQRLHSSCEYAVEGPVPDVNWWSVGVFSDRGQLITNSAERYAFNAGTLAQNPDGTFLVSLARDARPGNWLPTGGAGRLALVMTLHQAPSQAKLVRSRSESLRLPTIRRVQCR
jgi:hypothetical protein